MKVPNPRTPGQSEIPEVPEDAARYLEKYLNPRDKAVKDIIDAMQGKLSPKDNFRYERRQVNIHHNTATTVALEKVKNPSEVRVEWTAQDDFCHLKWKPLDQAKIQVTIKFDTDPGEATSVNLGVWGD